MPRKIEADQLRSYRWFGPDNDAGLRPPVPYETTRATAGRFYRQARDRHHQYVERNQPLPRHLRERAEAVKRGVWQAGGFPVEIPAFSITETYMKPSPMLYRNLLAMETEGAASQPAGGWRGADGRLRQDYTRTAHGRHQHEHPGVYLPGRADAARQLERSDRSAAEPTSGSIGLNDAPGHQR